MEKYKVIDSGHTVKPTHQQSDEVVLHEDIIEILFKHKEEMYRKLIDLRSIFLIDHIAITIVDPNNQMVIFSITPSVEYNLIAQGLWKHDYSFSPSFQKNNAFYSWEKAYSEEYFHEIKYVKELKHGFTCGFSISKKIGGFYLIYSYATRSKNSDLYDYYFSHIKELSGFGDYGYKLIRSIYKKYAHPNLELPSITCKQRYSTKPHLRLINNNVG